MANDLTTRSDSSLPETRTWQPSETTQRLLAAGESGGRIGDDGQFAGTSWRVPWVPDDTRRDLQHDEASLRARLEATPTLQTVVNALASLSLVCQRRSSLSEQEATAQLRALAGELVEFPSECVDRAVKAYGRENKWMPTLSEILPYVEREADEMRRVQRRLQAMLNQRREPKRSKPWQPPTKAEREEGSRMARAFVQAMREQEEAERKRLTRSGEVVADRTRHRLPPGPATLAAEGKPYTVIGREVQPVSDDPATGTEG